MTWQRPGDKPMSEPTTAEFIDEYTRPSASMRLYI